MADNGFGRFVLGFWIGAAVGAALALILTPYSGEEMQQQLQERSTELKGQMQESAGRVAEEAKARAQQVAGTVRDQVAQVEQQGRVALSRGVEGAQHAADAEEARANRAADSVERSARLNQVTRRV